MQFPYYFTLFGEKVYYHFILETLAFVVGIRVYYFLRKRSTDSISDENRLWILVGAMVGALIGSRVIANLETPTVFLNQSFLSFYENKTVAGGLLGGLFGVELIKKFIGEKTSSGDLYVVPLLIALIIGRIGCFSMGVFEPTFGIETSFFTGINLGDGKLRHPVSLYEIVFCLLLLGITYSSKKIHLKNGDRFKWFMVLYFLYRFIIEFLKPYESLFLGLSSIHLSAIFIFIYYIPLFLRYTFKKQNYA